METLSLPGVTEVLLPEPPFLGSVSSIVSHWRTLYRPVEKVRSATEPPRIGVTTLLRTARPRSLPLVDRHRHHAVVHEGRLRGVRR